MISTTAAVKTAIADRHKIKARVTILLNDNPDNPTNLTLESDKLMAGGVTVHDGTSSSGSFDIGAAIINQCTILLDNTDGAYSAYNFEGAVATVFAGVATNDAGTAVTWLKKGMYVLSDPTTTPAIMTLKGVDYMAKFDRKYSGGMTFPRTLASIVQYCCSQCGVTLGTSTFNNSTYRIESNPFGNASITYRQILSYCAQIACCYARINVNGRLELKWYSKTAFDTGNEAQRHSVTKFSQGPVVNTEDVVITGVKVIASDAADGTDGEEYTYGNAGYVLEIKDNPLIAYGKAQEVAALIGASVVGMRFRPGNASFLGDPTMEAGDAAILTDRKNNQYKEYVTNLTYSIGNFASFSCDAVPALRKSADRYSRIAATVAKLRKEIPKQVDAYMAAQAHLDALAFNALGFYETTETLSDGSKIIYAHDAPTLAESTIVYKKSIDGFFLSRNGGRTYSNGFDSAGNAVLNMLAVIGLSATWVKTGKLESQDGTVSIDLDNNTINLKGITNFDGFATKSGLGTSGYTTINGSNITTGSIKDANSNTVFNLSDGSLTMKKGSINIGSGNFSVDTSGNMSAKNATITGGTMTTTATGTISGVSHAKKLIVGSAIMDGYDNNSRTGLLDLAATYESGKHASLKSFGTLHLQGVSQISFEIGSSNAQKVYINNSGIYGDIHGSIHATDGYSGWVSLPVQMVSDGTVNQWVTVYVRDGIITS